MTEPYDWEKDPFFNAFPNCACKGKYTHESFIHTPYICQSDEVTFGRNWKDRHKHVVAEILGDYYENDPWRSDGAKCSICGKRLNEWYCPKSEDHLCHYSRSWDSCDFCGMPGERK